MTDQERDECFKEFLHRRGVDIPCSACSGYGVRLYSNTSTWKKGMGGNKCTKDVCNICWGTGDLYNRGLDLEEQRITENARISQRGFDLLAHSIGTSMLSLELPLTELVKELDKLSRGRKTRPEFFINVCMALSRTIKDGILARKRLEK
jgi:hypothetical protein